MEKPQLIGLSPFLSSQAIGHHLPYHSRAYQLFSMIADTKYVGKISQIETDTWYLKKFPKGMSRPKPLISQGKFNAILNSSAAQETSLFYVYEGSIYWAVLAMRHMQNNYKSAFIVNLFDSRTTTMRLTGRNRFAWIFLYKIIIRLCKGRLTYSVDNLTYYELLKNAIGDSNVVYIPLFPSFELIEPTHSYKNNKILISIRGPEGKKFLTELAPFISKDKRIVVHGLSSEYLLEIGLPLAQVSSHIPIFADYIKSCHETSKCLLFYETGNFSYQSSGRLIDFHELRLTTLVPEGSALKKEFGNCGLVQGFDYKDLNRVVKFINDSNALQNHECNCRPRAEQFQKTFLQQIEKKTTENVFAERLGWSSIILSLSIKFIMDVMSLLTLQGRLSFGNIRDHARELFGSNFL